MNGNGNRYARALLAGNVRVPPDSTFDVPPVYDTPQGLPAEPPARSIQQEADDYLTEAWTTRHQSLQMQMQAALNAGDMAQWSRLNAAMSYHLSNLPNTAAYRQAQARALQDQAASQDADIMMRAIEARQAARGQ